MYTIKFEEGKHYKLYGNDYIVLLSRKLTDRVESELVRVRKGSKTPKHIHDDLEQIYIITEGKAVLEINGEKKQVCKGMMAYIPRGAEHRIAALENLEYIYISCWFEKVPPPRTDEELKTYEKKLLEGDKFDK